MKAVIDRFEGCYAILEDYNGNITEIKKDLLPKGSNEGDCIRIEGNKITVDAKETKKRKSELQKLFDNLIEP